MSKKHIFLSIFSKITIFACVFCTLSAWSDTTTCDIDFTPVTGNSWRNGTPTPTTPVEIESIGTKVGNKYAVQVAVNYDGGVVDLGTLNWSYGSGAFQTRIEDADASYLYLDECYSSKYIAVHGRSWDDVHNGQIGMAGKDIRIKDSSFGTDTTAFKQAMSGVMLYYQRATDETWTAPTLKTVYLDEPLRKVGDYADVLDYKNGTITRNIGVKVLDGTENWSIVGRYPNSFYLLFSDAPTTRPIVLSSHYEYNNAPYSSGKNAIGWLSSPANGIGINDLRFTVITDFKSYLAQQYANGTPVIVYYPLATLVVEQIENWSCPVPITDIKIATTKMVDEEFAAAEANLAATVQTIESVVSRTIAQTGQIATLQAEKQTRPDENCPANMKCLLVQDEDGTPHWYPIIEP